MTPTKLGAILIKGRRASVTIIATLLFGSACIRLLTGTNEVFAQESQIPNASMPTNTSENTSDTQEDPMEAKNPTDFSALKQEGLSELIKSFSNRERTLVAREQALEMRLKALSVADSEIEKRLKILTEAEEALRSTLALADQASEKDLLRLTSVYENMKPKEAAALFEEMEPNFAAGFLGRMRPDVAASIMAGLTPQVAYSISVILAGRNATVPKT